MSDWRHLQQLEAESIHIMREVVAEFQRPVMLYSIGKDSSVLLRLAQKAFYPGPIPFPLLHVDTAYKFREMIEFRDRYTAELGAQADRPYQSRSAGRRSESVRLGHAAVLRRAEDHVACSMACAKADSMRRSAARAATKSGPAPRNAFSPSATRAASGIRATSGRSSGISSTPASIPARACACFRSRTGPSSTSGSTSTRKRSRSCRCISPSSARCWCAAIRCCPVEQPFVPRLPGEEPQMVMCRMRSLGCSPCTGAIRSDADTVPKIIEELISVRRSERENRVIDHDQDGSMEIKKREGYF